MTVPDIFAIYLGPKLAEGQSVDEVEPVFKYQQVIDPEDVSHFATDPEAFLRQFGVDSDDEPDGALIVSFVARLGNRRWTCRFDRQS